MSGDHKIELLEPPSGSLVRRGSELPAFYEVPDPDDGPDLRSYWWVVKKRRWTILSALLVVVTLGLIATFKQKPIYRAHALLEIQKENPNILTVQELFQLENVSDNYLETQYKILRSESLARRVVSELHLDKLQEFNPTAGLWFWKTKPAGPGTSLPPSNDAEQAVLRSFSDQLNIEPVLRSRLVQVSFDSQDPELAAKVVNSVTRNYVDENLENRWDATQKASEWMAQQLQGVKAKLEKSEDDLQQYAQANSLLFLETEKGEIENMGDERLRQLQDELTKAEAERYSKESLYRLVTAGDFGSLPGVVDNKLMQDLTVRLADLEREKAALAETFTNDYPKVKQLQSQIDNIEILLAEERKRAAQAITNDYTAAVRRENLIRQAFAQQEKDANLMAARSVQYKILKREVDTNKQLYEGLLQRLKEAGVSAGLKASNIRIVDAAVAPTKRVKPRPLLNLAWSLALGLATGLGIASLQERLDNTLKTPDDVERFLRLPALALIPSQASSNHNSKERAKQLEQRGLLSVGNGKHGSMLKQLTNGWIRIDGNGMQHAAFSEAFRGLRTSVLLSTPGRPPRSLVFSSAEPSEGKTTIASNLAIALTQLGKRVLLIDADMRRPCVHRLFGIRDYSTGLVTYLTGQQDWRTLVRPSGTTGLDCLVCGPVPPNPSELLSSERMHELVHEATEEYHFVLVDSPPLLNVADGRILTTMVEGAILVVKGGATPRELVLRTQSYFRDVGAHLIGVVLNDIDLHQAGYYDGYYRYYREYGGPNQTASA